MRVKVELIAIELPQFGSAKSRDLDLESGTNVADALSGLGVDADPALLAMVNGEAVPRDQWPETPLSPDDTVSLFRPFKGG
ncbi:MAG: sulfur carrier protein ThiS [Rhodospirillales bacterium]|nr:sulfur carrier protein ThiS [Rhodospirillales bacterium]